ncbi:DUF2066 domain-containing protein [Marinivivus vitaminiproducens]|uniref:DUF2066 domain-containing protein n=1 Tax=Marinivivus vitaminiproducens TaxID=3035935 RepID=UPI0027A08309|nr:DUF2066 domain-containing protein [Geminicoccaceae bacterium SCSIO 64248]
MSFRHESTEPAGAAPGMTIHACAVKGLLGLVLIFVLAAAVPPATAQTARDPYNVGGIRVDVTAADAVAAQNEAVAAGHRDGLMMLLRRLTPEDYHARLPRVGTGEAETYVASYGVESEQRSSTRYIASLSVSYLEEPVRQLLRGARIPFTDAGAPPRVLVPLYDGPEGAALWEGANPWRSAMATQAQRGGLVAYTLPLGDLEDQIALDPARAAAMDTAGLDALKQRYATDTAIVARIANVQVADDDSAVLQLQAAASGPPENVGVPLSRTIRGATLDEALAAAALAVDEWQSDAWRDQNLVRFDQAASIEVGMTVSSLSEWVTIRRALESRPEIDDVSVLAIGRREALVRLTHLGSIAALQGALADEGFSLSPDGARWRLQPSAGMSSPSALPGAITSSPL